MDFELDEELFVTAVPECACPLCSGELFVFVGRETEMWSVVASCSECEYESVELTRLFGCSETSRRSVFEAAQSAVASHLEE